MSDAEDKFRNIVNGNYGQMESVLGQEGYQSQVEYNNANAELMRAHAKLLEAQTAMFMAQLPEAGHSLKSTNAKDYAKAVLMQHVSLILLVVMCFMIVLGLIGAVAACRSVL